MSLQQKGAMKNRIISSYDNTLQRRCVKVTFLLYAYLYILFVVTWFYEFSFSRLAFCTRSFFHPLSMLHSLGIGHI